MPKRNRRKKQHDAPPVALPSLLAITPVIDGKVNHGYTHSLLGIQAACISLGIRFNWSFVVGNSMLVAARNRCAAKFLDQSTADYLLMMDADISVDWNDAMVAFLAQKDVVALPCIKRRIDWGRAVAAVRGRQSVEPEAIEAVLGQPNFILDMKADPQKEDADLGLMEATHAGTGCMIISRKALERFKAEYPDRWYMEHIDGEDIKTHEFFRYGRRDNFFIGEDYTFCDDWRAIGGKIFVKVDGRTTHRAELALRYNLAEMHALEG